MKSKAEYFEERRKAIERLEKLNQDTANELARVLRLNDQYKLICKERGEQPEITISEREMDAAYRILSFGTKVDRWAILLGSSEDRKRVIYRTLEAGGFNDENQRWIEL